MLNFTNRKNRTDSALKYINLTISLKDTLFNQQKTRAAQAFVFNEQLHQQELAQKLKQTELIYRSRLNISILLSGIIILLVIAGGLWRKNIYKQKSFGLLQKQKQEIDNQRERAEKTLENLKSAQSQLIQSEKMASLGELTAGIAHEIQNPLNFVNNFSDVNAELIDESIDAINAGNPNEAIQLLSNLRQNEEKIKFHGQRADTIVKGMLQHSRESKGQKELTDINLLTDEYLRLSYHGLRAKDKSFNSVIHTDYDSKIGSINIIPQDIGRVLLNLYNNAFYALSEKKKQLSDGFEPCVTVTTKKLIGKISIIVKDNGNGIPQKVLDKIFQPFFTTKPAGQGTGLGLSISYDIIKAHGGQLKVNTKEGEYAEFVMELPA